MKFFQWLKWFFSKQQKHTFTKCIFNDIVGDFEPKENGTSYQYNIQYTFVDCKVIKTEDPVDYTPLLVDVKINMEPIDYGEIFIHPFIQDKKPLIVINKDDKPVPFTIVSKLEPQLSEQEKEDIRVERFVDAMIEWNTKHDR